MKKHLLSIVILLSSLFFKTAEIKAQTIGLFAGNGYAAFAGDGGQATSAELSSPYGITIDASGNIYIADTQNNCIRKVSTDGIITTVAGIGGGSGAYSGDGGQATAAMLSSPYNVTFDVAGNMYIADAGNMVVRMVNTAGIITTIAGNGTLGYSGDGGLATGAKLYEPRAITVDASGTIYIADGYNNRIRRIKNDTITTYAGDGTSGYSGDGGAATAAQVWGNGLAIDAVGNLYIAEGMDVRMVNTAGIITTFAGTGVQGFSGDGGQATSAQFYGELDITFDAAGNLYIADMRNNRIRKINTSGIINTIGGSVTWGYTGDGGPATSATLNDPRGVVVDATGNVYFVDFGNDRLRIISNCSFPSLSIIGQTGLCSGGTATLTASGATNYLWSVNAGSATTNTVSATPTITTTYTLIGANSVCRDSTTYTLNVAAAVVPNICMVTTDSATNYFYNIVYWDKTPYTNVDSFIVYRKDALSSNYLRIGAVNKDSLSRFIDTAFSIGGPNGGNPQYSSWTYKLAIKDTCGNIGTQSPYHQTMFVQQNNANFSWNAYTVESGQTNSVTGYSFLRDNNNTGAWHVLANTTGISTTDPNYTSYPNGNWRVDAIGFNCTPTLRLAYNNNTQSTYSKAHSNTSIPQHLTGINQTSNNITLALYPNPTNQSFVIETNTNQKQFVQVFDVTGKIVLSQNISGTTTIDASSLSQGVYNISISSNQNIVNKKLIIVR